MLSKLNWLLVLHAGHLKAEVEDGKPGKLGEAVLGQWSLI
jgi:hypothetical protein